MDMIINKSLEGFRQFLELNKFDVLICSSSFENRCKIIPSIIQNQVKNIMICHYEDNYQKANENFSELLSYFKSPVKVVFEKNNPLMNIDNISNALHNIQINKKLTKRVLVDITTLTREMIFILIYFFKNVPPVNKNKVTFVYNPAEKYSIDKENISDKWLSKGVRDIRSVLGYSGLFVPDKKLALILLVGFEQERAKKIIDTFEPSIVYLGYASIEGAITKELQEINKKVFEELKNILTIDIVQFEFSCKTPHETEEKVTEIIKSIKKEYNVVISGLNNKISSIGVAFAALENPEVQICYPTVNQYNFDNYSISKDEIYLIDINS